MSVGVVVNPVAGSGRVARLVPRLVRVFDRQFGRVQLMETRGPGDASRIARDLALAGVQLVIAVGGDGTISETADGLLSAGNGQGGPHLGIVAAGTGSDFARGEGIGGTIERMVERIAVSPGRPLDAGRVTFLDGSGRLATRHFINIASAGLSGETAAAVNEAGRKSRLPGKVVFFLEAAKQILGYRFRDLRVSVDGLRVAEGRVALVAVANSRYFGGGMKIAPSALSDDGELDVVVVMTSSRFTLLRELPAVYVGAHRRLKSCLFLRGRQIVIEAGHEAGDPSTMVEIDGEAPGRLPASFEVLPGALLLRA